jgi:hypothetical protein
MERRKLFIQILVVSILCIALVGLAVAFRVFSPKDTVHKVTFRVESSGGIVNLTFRDSNNYQKDRAMISTPWERTWVNPSGTEVYVTAGNPTQMGTIKCTIKIDGKLWKSDQAQMPDDAVVCAGIVP